MISRADQPDAPPGAARQPPGESFDWSRQRERSNLWVLRLMRWIALRCGRRAARLLLHPIALYFVCANAAARRASAGYLGRVYGRPARLREVYRHVHTFAATILDRVYLLQDDCRTLALDAVHTDLLESARADGRGLVLVGAHFGSFEALRALGQRHGVKVAMLMYEDNAQLINATLAAIAPGMLLHTIALGRVDAMLQLRDWLDGGGVAGLLADRTLQAGVGRSRSHMLDFLGAPAAFSDGPFRLAAMMRRPMVFMAGVYHGGNRYELRFEPLADFTTLAAAETDVRVREALERYVAAVESLCRESPYNWFNFYDFWADHARRTEPV